MTDVVRWLIAIEVIGFAFLPLTFWLLKWLPDRGYAFAKILGLVLVTYVVFAIGNLLPVAGSVALPITALAIAGVAGWVYWRREVLQSLRTLARLVILEELLFLVAFVVWSLLRVHVFDSGIAHTEQFMDMMLLNSALGSHSYPPHDLWMSGHGVNYYYFGYLMFATLTRLSGVSAAVGYNLSLSLLFAATVSCAYSLGYALIRRPLWGLLAPLLVGLVGNWHAILWQIPHRVCFGAPGFGFWDFFWPSTRVVGGNFSLADWACSHAAGTPTDYTINEFPLFSFILGDLHPHVMALPVTLLAVAIGANIVFAGKTFVSARLVDLVPRLVLVALCIGSLFTINSWDFPTYGLLMASCILVCGYIADPSRQWWKRPLLVCIGLAIASFGLFTPFYLRFKPLAHGVALVHSRTDLFEYFQVFGLFLLLAACLLTVLVLLLQPAEAEETSEQDEQSAKEPARAGLRPSAGAAITLIALAIVVAIVVRAEVLVIALALVIAAYLVLERVLNSESPNRGDAVALIMIGIAGIVLALTEIIYLRDSFDGTGNYRMNTVFKFYYQAWVLLGLAGTYGIFRIWNILARIFSRRYAYTAAVLITIAVLSAGIYTAFVPSASVADFGARSLDGQAWIGKEHPRDYQAIQWLRSHAHDEQVVLEATGGEYSYFARISTFSGLPTVMGWAGHESQWRGSDPEIGRRATDVGTIYQSGNIGETKRFLRKYKVKYVVVGDQETTAYGKAAHLDKFSRFMRIVHRSEGTTIYSW